MSMVLVPLMWSLLHGPAFPGVSTTEWQEASAEAPDLVLIQEAPPVEAKADDAAGLTGEDLMEQVWRRYRRLGSASVTTTGHQSWAGGRVDPIRIRTMLAPTAEMKVLATDHVLTFKEEVVYAESAYYPGMQIMIPVEAVPDAALNALAQAWPPAPVPLPVRLRLASSAKVAFAPFLALVGENGTVDAQTSAWPDGRPARVLRLRDGEGATDLAIWIDTQTGLIRGVRGRVAGQGGMDPYRIKMLYETVETQSAPPIVVPNRNVTRVGSFGELQRVWLDRYAVPPSPRDRG